MVATRARFSVPERAHGPTGSQIAAGRDATAVLSVVREWPPLPQAKAGALKAAAARVAAARHLMNIPSPKRNNRVIGRSTERGALRAPNCAMEAGASSTDDLTASVSTSTATTIEA